MPALSNPRYERFAQALFAGLAGETRVKRAQSTAYLQAYLQAESNARLQPKLDVSRERVGRRLALASEMAERLEMPNAMATSELGIAKVFGHMNETPEDAPTDFANAKTMTDIGRKLLQSIGFASPDDVSIKEAIKANDEFIKELERI